jgi:hypothetical protein
MFDAGGDDPVAGAVARKQADDDRKTAALVAAGTPAVRLVYEDGSQHRAFREPMMATGAGLGEVSRPEALAADPREIAMPAAGLVVSADRRESARVGATPKVGTPPRPAVAEAERRRLLKVFATASEGRD